MCTFGAVDLSFNHADAGYFLKSLTGHDHGPTIEESIFVVNNGHSATTLQASYGPYATQQGVAPALVKASHVNESHVVTSINVADGLLDISGHIVSRSLMLDSPILQVLFHGSYADSMQRRGDRRQHNPNTYNTSTLWCTKLHVLKDAVELTSSCVLDPSITQGDVCIAQLAMPREWWSASTDVANSQPVDSVDVYYSVSGPFSDNSECSMDVTDNTATPVVDSVVKIFVSTVTLQQSQLTFQEVQEDQHILVYIPEKSFYPGARFSVPVKLQAESDLQLFVVR